MKPKDKEVAEIADCSPSLVRMIRSKERKDSRNIQTIESDLQQEYKKAFETVKEKHQKKRT